uniref:TIL domain-containing protein n=1 Tax=Anopheles dirus TaxID=7168 RepID=A0A182NFI0_9DIPT
MKPTVLLLTLLAAAAQQTSETDAPYPCLERRACAPGETFVCCGTCDEPTCSKPQPKNNCVNVCIAGCFCKPGYIRRVIGGPCILANGCPKTKPKPKPVANKTHLDRGVKLRPCRHSCGKQKKGTRRFAHASGQQKHHQAEAPGMNWTIVALVAAGCCALGAAQTDAPTQTTTTATPSTAFKGFVPVASGAKCPVTTCGRNEMLRTCGLCYENTCNSQSVEICKRVCYCGCYCKTGYVRVTQTGPCILPKQCPKEEIEY